MKIRLPLLSLVLAAASCLAVIACADDRVEPAAKPETDAGPTPEAGPGTPDSTTPTNTELGEGLQVAVPWPAKGQMQHLSMALDDQGDPLLSYMLTQDAGTPDALYFTRWDRTVGAWTAPLKVDDVGLVENNDPFRETSIAFDTSTKEIAIAYQGDADPSPSTLNDVRLARSTDGGKSFAKEQVSVHGAGNDHAHGASLALRGGTIHIVYTQENQPSCQPVGNVRCGYYATRTNLDADAGPGKPFTRTHLDIPVGAQEVRTMPTDLALDSAGNPAFVYFTRGALPYDTQIFFARPGSAPVQVMTTSNIQNDVVSASLAFDGDKPRVVAHLKSVADATYDMQYATSDNGTAWTVQPLPRMGTHTTLNFQSLSITSNEVVVAAQFSTSTTPETCGGPKILRSKAGAAFEVSCPDVTTLPSFAGRYVGIRHRADGKLVMSFIYTPADNTKLARGLIVWREK